MMPSNVYVEDKLAYKWIDKQVGLIKKKRKATTYKGFLREILMNFAISRSKAENFLKEFYIDEGELVVEEDGRLRGVANGQD